ncbi:MAG: Threonyl and alanyl tRNA synthetase domain protein [Candidatus Moranbacteria bacterium GW2011_GWF2_36_839]|nr:MAG: Threonyl and alanyl tRNA synthetase domain protein [Candidatus Moranbacteria bacterium GW2011_GWF1_36_78]KKQ16461.1 MAG: Threonyl and alanyl tRNA synthetase domain protein [Candidatus Moranbacteria bacterium GW2011_GWF2_36_839]HAT74156.1 hypothetical protein [Candidatus Moranbacteria bacterium]HBY11219.1 hypothetical protein [Candidatus Moranbacteria bacterium]
MHKFHENSYLTEIKTIVVGIFSENEKNCVQVEENIFYPQGGGQKGDRGKLIIDGINYDVIDTIKDSYNEDGILLITAEKIPDDAKGKSVGCSLDWEFRCRQMKLHTAVHLHHCLLEKIAGKSLPFPKVSAIQDGFAFNRYESDEITPELVEKTNQVFREAIASGAEVKTYPDVEKKGFRFWECLGYKIPCGGMHVKNISEIGEVETAYNKKKGMPTVNIKLK